MFSVPERIAAHIRLLNAWAAEIGPFAEKIRLPQALNEADFDEDAAIETYDLFPQPVRIQLLTGGR